jgi:hypothetical protein
MEGAVRTPLTQLWHFDEKSDGSDFGNAGNALQNG